MTDLAITEAVNASQQQVLDRLRPELREVVHDPELWLRTPHALLGGREPLVVACADARGEEIVRNLILMIKTGMFT